MLQQPQRHLILALLGLVLMSPPLHAHAIGLSCKRVGEQVHVEAYFDDDTPARQARIVVRDSAGAVVTEGTTDEQGLWDFPSPAPGVYEVTVDAGAGHRARQSVTIPAAATVLLSAAPTRGEFTRVPWLRLALGLILIALAALAFQVARRRAKPAA